MIRAIVLHGSLQGHAADRNASRLLAGLAYAKRLELERAAEPSRRASLLGIKLALDALEAVMGRRPEAGSLRFPGGRKPFLPDGPSFSISHCRQRVAVAASADCELGIDIEDRAESRAAMGVGPERLWRWTAVEATLKAAGCGLRGAQRVVLCEEGDRARFDNDVYHLRRLELDPAVVSCVASDRVVDDWSVERSG
jgi:phosphopantetheinyl transferase